MSDRIDRASDDRLDLFVAGTVYLDIIFTGLDAVPAPGTEVFTLGMGSCPGGIANLAVAASRLGLRTGLGTPLSSDVYGDFCWQTLKEENIDLSASRRFDDWHSPVTVSLAYDRDRSMVTHGHPAPLNADGLVGELPPARGAFLGLGHEPMPWVRRAREAGTLVFASVGWDSTATWPAEALAVLSDCYAFLPNSVEAMRYTRADTPREALHRLAERVPVVVVTCGSDGAMAVDSGTGETASALGVPVDALDPTGAGDVFGAGFATGTLAGWPLDRRLAFANLVAALSVQHFGGSLSAPGWGDIADWWRATRARAERHHAESTEAEVARRYGFLDDVIPAGPMRTVRRATATIARLSDANVGGGATGAADPH
ncbi:PfkB family carbohydrate kinase [Micromonospora sp. NPDC049559]|uniref:carbohydrate kinase family protein n=1 Tax=Micromonospora sp. NPDC049559 TaxID=3155923 RepID=UPI00341F508F